MENIAENIVEIMSEKTNERIVRRAKEGIKDLYNDIYFCEYKSKEDLLPDFKHVYSFEKIAPIAAKEGSDKEFLDLITKQVLKIFNRDFENIIDILNLKDMDKDLFTFKIYYFSEFDSNFKNEEYLKVNVNAVPHLRVLGHGDIELDPDYLNAINLILNKQFKK